MPNFGPSSVRTRSAVERAAAFRALSLGLPQSAAKYSSNDADRVGAVAGVALPGKKLMHIGNRQLAQNLSAQRWLEVQTHRVRVAVRLLSLTCPGRLASATDPRSRRRLAACRGRSRARLRLAIGRHRDTPSPRHGRGDSSPRLLGRSRNEVGECCLCDTPRGANFHRSQLPIRAAAWPDHCGSAR